MESDPETRPVGRPRRVATSAQGFYGWRIVGFSCVGLAMTAPGQTTGVSAFINPMIEELGISRSTISTAYLIGTLAGAIALPRIGRMIDRYGIRRMMAVIAGVFGAFLMAMAAVQEVVGLTAGFVGIRMFGQGALSMTATTAVALWFDRRRGLAVGLVSAIGAGCISLAPVGLEALVSVYDWRTVWMIEAGVVWAVVIPMAIFGMRDRPSDLGQLPDGVPPGDKPAEPPDGMTRREVLRTGLFWVVSGAVTTTGMLGTALAFHQIDLLGEHGLTPTQAAANFVPQTVASLLVTIATGAMIDRLRPQWSVTTSMFLLAIGLLWATQVSPGWSAIGLGLIIGAANGSIRSVEGASFPRYFGTKHLGAIRGVATAMGVGGAAFGPLLFALGRDLAGTYTPVLIASAAIPLAVGIAAFVVPAPDRRY